MAGIGRRREAVGFAAGPDYLDLAELVSHARFAESASDPKDTSLLHPLSDFLVV